MKLFGKVLLTLAACIVIGSAVSAAAYPMAHAPYYYPYYSPYAPAYAPYPYAYAAPHPVVTHVEYGVRAYPVYGASKAEVSYVPYVHKPFLYQNTYVQVPAPVAFPTPGPVIIPNYWKQMHHWW